MTRLCAEVARATLFPRAQHGASARVMTLYASERVVTFADILAYASLAEASTNPYATKARLPFRDALEVAASRYAAMTDGNDWLMVLLNGKNSPSSRLSAIEAAPIV